MIQSLKAYQSLPNCKSHKNRNPSISMGYSQLSVLHPQLKIKFKKLPSNPLQLRVLELFSVRNIFHIYNIYMSMHSLAQYILYIICRAGRSATEKILSSSKQYSMKKLLASSLKILVCRGHPKGFSTNEELNRGKGADLFISTRKKSFFSGKLLSFRKLFGLGVISQFLVCRDRPKGFSTNEKLNQGWWGVDKKMSLQPILPTMPVITKLHGGSMTKLETILSIDLGTNTGWAFRSKNGQITSGTIYFKPQRFEGGGMRYLRFCLWLDELLETTGKIDAVYFEEVRRHLGVTAAHTYGGFLGHLTSWCEHYKIPYLGVPVGTIKHFIAGKGNAGKEDVIAAIRSLGHKPADDNEADALALLYLALNKQMSIKSLEWTAEKVAEHFATTNKQMSVKPSEWTAEKVAEHFQEAVSTIKKLPPVKVQSYFNSWPSIQYTLNELALMEVQIIKLKATPDEISRLEETFEWMQWINTIERKLIWKRAVKVPWKIIYWEFGFSQSTARRRWKHALTKISNQLNKKKL